MEENCCVITMIKIKALFLLFSGSLLFSSCKKEKEEEYTCACITKHTDSFMNWMYESEIKIKSKKSKAEASCIALNKTTYLNGGGTELATAPRQRSRATTSWGASSMRPTVIR